MEEAGLSYETVKKYLSYVRSWASYAIREYELTIANPFEGLSAVRGEHEESGKESFTYDEVRKLLLHRSETNDELADIVLLMVYAGGARIGEIAGLAKSDLQLNGPIPFIRIRKNAIRRIKTDASVRDSAANTFKAVAEEYIEKQGREGRAEATLVKARWHLALLKKLHLRAIGEIESVELLAELRKVEGQGHLEAARQVRAFASRVFCYGVATARCKYDVAAPLVKALITPKVTHRAAILDPIKVGQLLRAIDGFEGQITTKLPGNEGSRDCACRNR